VLLNVGTSSRAAAPWLRLLTVGVRLVSLQLAHELDA
jgi:hypothetical protein